MVFKTLFLSYVAIFAFAYSFDVSYKCQDSQLVIYAIDFVTNWTKELFPKQYPEWRPPAQWSKVVGITHSEKYHLFQIGAESSDNFKVFAETGKIEQFFGSNHHNDSIKLILDEFVLPATYTGANTSTGRFFVDATHSKVSLTSKIVPSPDWFVGIDSLELCSDGHWIDRAVIEATPLDAGTDSGFTFTAPNWPTVPQEKIFKITAQYPRHPANSFYYPSLEDLPPIAFFRIKKELEFRANPKQKIVDNEILDNETKSEKSMKKKRKAKHRRPVHCKVGPWSMWTSCKTICGQSVRKRNVVVRPSKNGEPCPPLREEKMCDCNKEGLFKW